MQRSKETNDGCLIHEQVQLGLRNRVHSGYQTRTSEDFGVVVTQSQGAHCHDLWDGTEPEDLWISEFLEIPEALRRMPTCTTKGRI